MEQPPLVSHSLGGTRSASSSALLADRYRLQAQLGRVGTAQVHQGWDELLERPVTVKVFDHAAGTPGGGLRDQPELQHLAGLSHPGLVTVWDAGTDRTGTTEQRSFLVLERVRGTTLARRIATGPLPVELVAEIGAHLATTLAYLHQHGVAHRGVQPAAVLLSTTPPGHPRSLTVKLSDAGTARVLEDTTITSDPVSTGPGPDRRPVHAAEADLGPAGDISCLALLLLEALTGRRIGSGAESAVAAPPRPPIIPEDLDPGWAPLLAAMTHPDPADRPPATEVAEALGALAEAPTVSAETPPLTGLAAIGLRHHPRMRTRHHHRRWLLIPAASAVLLTALALSSTASRPAPTVAATPAPRQRPPPPPPHLHPQRLRRQRRRSSFSHRSSPAPPHRPPRPRPRRPLPLPHPHPHPSSRPLPPRPPRPRPRRPLRHPSSRPLPHQHGPRPPHPRPSRSAPHQPSRPRPFPYRPLPHQHGPPASHPPYKPAPRRLPHAPHPHPHPSRPLRHRPTRHPLPRPRRSTPHHQPWGPLPPYRSPPHRPRRHLGHHRLGHHRRRSEFPHQRRPSRYPERRWPTCRHWALPSSREAGSDSFPTNPLSAPHRECAGR